MSDLETSLRATLTDSGLVQRMKAVFLDAALDLLNKDPSAKPKSDPKLLKPSPKLTAAIGGEAFTTSMMLVVDFLRHYNLQHTLNCFKAECGPDVFPADTDADETQEEINEEHKLLCEDLGLEGTASALEALYDKASMTQTHHMPMDHAASLEKQMQEAAQQQQKSQQQQQSPTRSASFSAGSSPASATRSSPTQAAAAAASTTSPVKESPKKATTSAPSSPSSSPAAAPAGAGDFQNFPLAESMLPEVTCTSAIVKGPKASESPYVLENMQGGEFIRYGKITGQQFILDTVSNCRILVFDAIDSSNMDDVDNCEIVIAACENSLFLRNVTNCRVIAACKQLRTRDCKNLKINLFTTTDPVIEASSDIDIFPFNLEAPKLCSAFKSARLDPKNNRFIHVYDFTKAEQAQNFKIHFPDHQGTTMVRCGEALDDANVESPPEILMLLNGEIGPAASLERGAGKSLDIAAGAKTWKNQQMDAQQTTTTTTKPSGKQSSPHDHGSSSSASTSAASSDTEGSNAKRPPTTSAKPAASPKPASKTVAKDPYMLTKDTSSSSSSDSGYSSFDDDDDNF